MPIRRIFAGSIVALLLSVSPLAVACDLSCAFGSMKSDCHSERAELNDSASGSMKMVGMAMGGMTMPGKAGTVDQQEDSAAARANVGHPSVGEMGPCEKQACDNGAALTAKTTRPIDSHSLSRQAVPEIPCADNGPAIFHGARDDFAAVRNRAGNPLHLSLRI